MNQHESHEEGLITDIKSELSQIEALEMNDAVQRYEELHNKLNEALSSIEGM